MLRVIMLRVIMLSIVMLSVVMLSVVMLNVVAPPRCIAIEWRSVILVGYDGLTHKR
jgi:hypothetical protein